MPHQHPILEWFEDNWNEDGLSLAHASPKTNSDDIEQIVAKVLDPPKKGHDHCGSAATLLSDAGTLTYFLVLATSQGKIPADKVKVALTTLRDHSRIGYLISFVTLLRIFVSGEEEMVQAARQFATLFLNTKLKSKLSQVH